MSEAACQRCGGDGWAVVYSLVTFPNNVRREEGITAEQYAALVAAGNRWARRALAKCYCRPKVAPPAANVSPRRRGRATSGVKFPLTG